jgi:CheY-like chemotaxis protein
VNLSFDATQLRSPRFTKVSKLCVLIVEDEPLIRAMTADLLAEAGCTVHEAENANEAIALIDDGAELDVMLADVRLPGPMDGVALSDIAIERRPNLKVVVTSGSNLPSSVRLPTGATFLPKPYWPHELRLAVAA